VAVAVAVLCAAVVYLPGFVRQQNSDLRVREISLSSDRAPAAGLRIVQLSDLHGKQFGENNTDLLEKIRAQSPDLIVFTGDLIDNPKDVELVLAFMGELVQSAPTLGVFGNHEARTGERSEFKERLEARGVVVLDNEIKDITLANVRVQVLGFDENNLTRRKHLRHLPLLEELEASAGLRIVLSHYPQEYSRSEAASFEPFGFDLMFAGHAHGGQWIIPGIGGLYAPGQGIFPTYYRGLYDNRLVVSPGLGNSHLPLRLNNFPEIIVVDLSP